MAIHIANPGKITDDVKKMHSLIAGEGKDFLKKYADIVEELSKHWTGSDAVANQKDLADVYSELTTLMKKIQNLIVSMNNNEVYPLLRHIELSGGMPQKKEMLDEPLSDVVGTVAITTEGNESMTTNDIIKDAADFNVLPEKFKNFKDSLISSKEELFKNWIDGADIANVKTSFKTFEDNVQSYITQLEKVRNNLNIVADNKSKFM